MPDAVALAEFILAAVFAPIVTVEAMRQHDGRQHPVDLDGSNRRDTRRNPIKMRQHGITQVQQRVSWLFTKLFVKEQRVDQLDNFLSGRSRIVKRKNLVRVSRPGRRLDAGLASRWIGRLRLFDCRRDPLGSAAKPQRRPQAFPKRTH